VPGVSLDLIQTVAIGPFNPHIIEPNWLDRVGICEKDKFAGFHYIPSTWGGRDTVFRFGRQEWQVDFTRLSVSSRSPSSIDEDDTGKAVASILHKLPHTPVRAIGHNFHFTCKLDEWGARPKPHLAQSSFNKSGLESPQRTSWTGNFIRGKANTNVTLSLINDAGIVVILFNHDHETNPEGHDEAIEAAGMFHADFEKTTRLLDDLFGIQWVP
jgi:hypothetical protein